MIDYKLTYKETNYRNIDHLLYDENGNYNSARFVIKSLLSEVRISNKYLEEDLNKMYPHVKSNLRIMFGDYSTVDYLTGYALAKYFYVDPADIIMLLENQKNIAAEKRKAKKNI